MILKQYQSQFFTVLLSQVVVRSQNFEQTEQDFPNLIIAIMFILHYIKQIKTSLSETGTVT